MKKDMKDTLRYDGPLSAPPEFEIVKDYVAPPMTEERIMWYGRGMRGEKSVKLNRPTQEFRIGAYIFTGPVSFDDDGNYIYQGKKLTPADVFKRVQAEIDARVRRAKAEKKAD